MSRFIINVLDGEERIFERDCSRMILSIGMPDRTDISICTGKDEDDQALLIADIMALLKTLITDKPRQVALAVELAIENNGILEKTEDN